MSETPLSDDEFRKLHDILQQLALAAYPNPERKECPGTAILREVASSSFPSNHPAYDHIKHCSPCLREMLDLQEQRLLTRTEQQYRMYRVAIAAMFVLVVLGGFLTWRLLHPRATTDKVASITHLERTVDLFDEPDVLRGGGESQKPFHTIKLPPAPLELKVVLPRFSRPGTYQIAICRERSEDSVLVKAVGRAVSDGPREIVTVMLDFSGLSKGSYWLATRGEDEGGSYFFPAKLVPGA